MLRSDAVHRGTRAGAARVVWADCLFLACVVLLSFAYYVHRLGFYSDDWHIVGIVNAPPERSLIDLYRVFNVPNDRPRPVQILYWIALAKLFRTDPLGYHLVTVAVFTTTIVLLYLVLHRLRLPRFVGLAVSLLYALLPNYATNRYWYSSGANVLAAALCYLAILLELRAVESRTGRYWLWSLFGFLSLLLSTLAYEVFLPFAVLIPPLLWFHLRGVGGDGGKRADHRRVLLFSTVRVSLTVALVVAFKTLTTVRAGIGGQSYAGHVRYLVAGAVETDWGAHLFGLPVEAWFALRDYFSGWSLGVGVLVGVVIGGYLWRISSEMRPVPSSGAAWCACIAVGLLVYALGYAIFLATRQISFRPTGSSNRVAIAATAGVAISVGGVIGLLSTAARSHRTQRAVFCLAVTLSCVASLTVTNTVAAFWVTAHRQQQDVLADIRLGLPTIPTGTTVLLDGVCPRYGPGVVFETDWDFGGVLKVMYRDPTLGGDVAIPTMAVTDAGITTEFEGETNVYPYGDTLLVYRVGERKAFPMTGAEAAREYVERYRADTDAHCWRGGDDYRASIFPHVPATRMLAALPVLLLVPLLARLAWHRRR